MALETIQEILDSGSDSIKMSRLRLRLQSVFPELKENEGNRMREWCISHFRACSRVAKDNPEYQEYLNNKVIPWLEKQGEMDMESYKAAEDEKREFVGDGFIKCYADFQDFKEGETYWLEYVGNDNYNVRSDNLLGKTYHITPCQLYTIFKKQTWLEKQGEQKPTQEIEPFEAEHGKYYYCIKDYFCGGRKQASKGDVVQALRGLPIMGLKDAGEYFLPVNSIKCNSTWSEEDEEMRLTILQDLQYIKDHFPEVNVEPEFNWLKSLKERCELSQKPEQG